MSRKTSRPFTIERGSASIRVVIVERRAHIRKEIRSVLEQDGEVEITGATKLPENVIPLIHARRPDVVLMGAGPPHGFGFETCQVIRRRFPKIRIIILAVTAESDMIRRAVSAGCHGYLVEPLSAQRIVPAVKAVIRDSFYFDFANPTVINGRD